MAMHIAMAMPMNVKMQPRNSLRLSNWRGVLPRLLSAFTSLSVSTMELFSIAFMMISAFLLSLLIVARVNIQTMSAGKSTATVIKIWSSNMIF